MKLYEISEEIVNDILSGAGQKQGNEIVKHVPEFKFPIKVVFERKMNLILVITVYPLKRAHR
jgi:hypothetical protein